MGGVYTENLLKRTKDFSGDSWYNTGIKWSKESEKIDGYTVISSDKSWGGMGCFVSVEGGKHYTYSFNAKTETSNYIYISVVISGSLDHDINGIFGRFVFIEGS